MTPQPALKTGAPPTRWSPNAPQIVLLSFSAFVLMGAAVLSLPIAHAGGQPHHWVDDLFTAASAVCVTGLATLDLGASYSLFGQLMILLLIQVGGLGYMTLFTVIMVLIGRRMSMRDRLNLQQATDQPGTAGLVGFIRNILLFTLAVESIGFVLLLFQTVPEFGWGRGTYMAMFYAVSSFNNAGFSLFPDSLVHWQLSPWPLLVIAGLVVIGGLGYNVNHEVVRRLFTRDRRPSRWDMLVRIVLAGTGLLLTGATFANWCFEHDNPKTLGAMPLVMQWVNAFFMAVSPRSSGFNSLDMESLNEATQLLFIPLMFVGAGPGGTGGGIKLTTIAVLIAATLTVAQGRDEVQLFSLRRRIGFPVVLRALVVFFLSILAVIVVAMLLAAFEPHPFMSVLLEAVSAFATVGLSLNLTAQLTDASKLLLVGTMVVGRVGVLTLMLAVFVRRERSAIRYQEEPLLIG